jgi:hypothetical protein
MTFPLAVLVVFSPALAVGLLYLLCELVDLAVQPTGSSGIVAGVFRSVFSAGVRAAMWVVHCRRW